MKWILSTLAPSLPPSPVNEILSGGVTGPEAAETWLRDSLHRPTVLQAVQPFLTKQNNALTGQTP